MGKFSSIHRFHGQGEGPNVNNMNNFGVPYRSLYLSTKFLSLHQRTEITDDQGYVQYRSESKVLTLHDRTTLFGPDGSVVANISKKFLTLHERHYIYMSDGTYFEMSNEIFHLIKDITNIEGLGWQLRGNCLGLNFELYDAEGAIIAVVGQKMISIHDRYCIDIYRPELEPYVVAIVLALQHMNRDRSSNSSSGGGSSSGN